MPTTFHAPELYRRVPASQLTATTVDVHEEEARLRAALEHLEEIERSQAAGEDPSGVAEFVRLSVRRAKQSRLYEWWKRVQR